MDDPKDEVKEENGEVKAGGDESEDSDDSSASGEGAGAGAFA